MVLQLLVSGCCMPLLTCYLILSHSTIIIIDCFKNANTLYDFSELMTSSKQSDFVLCPCWSRSRKINLLQCFDVLEQVPYAVITTTIQTMQNLVAVFHTVCAHVGSPKKLATLTPPLGCVASVTLGNTLLNRICHHTEFRRYISVCLGLIGVPKIWRDAEARLFVMGTWLTHWSIYAYHPLVLPCQIQLL